LQEGYEEIQAAGAKLIAISTDKLLIVGSTQQTLQATYLLLSDEETTVISAYNVVDPSDTDVARPATYIVDESGRIAWKFLDAKVGDRIGPARIVTELKKL